MDTVLQLLRDRHGLQAAAALEAARAGRSSDLPETAPEGDAHRVAQRQKQVDLGKNTLSYELYRLRVPRARRGAREPSTPDATRAHGRKQWDTAMRRWRRALHTYGLGATGGGGGGGPPTTAFAAGDKRARGGAEGDGSAGEEEDALLERLPSGGFVARLMPLPGAEASGAAVARLLYGACDAALLGREVPLEWSECMAAAAEAEVEKEEGGAEEEEEERGARALIAPPPVWGPDLKPRLFGTWRAFVCDAFALAPGPGSGLGAATPFAQRLSQGQQQPSRTAPAQVGGSCAPWDEAVGKGLG